MIRGEAHYDILHQEHQILLYDHERRMAFTISFAQHVDLKDSESIPATRIKKNGDGPEILRAIAEALKQLGLFPADANAAELKATKYHLEDMRQLVQNPRLGK